MHEDFVTAAEPAPGYGAGNPDPAAFSGAALASQPGAQPEAELCLKRALELHEQLLGPEHDSVAVDLNNLATFYLNEKQDVAAAEPLYQRALRIFTQTRRPEDAFLQTVSKNLAEAQTKRQAGPPAR